MLQGSTALDYAILYQHAAVAALLVQEGAQLQSQTLQVQLAEAMSMHDVE